jgi:hypothetical protein
MLAGLLVTVVRLSALPVEEMSASPLLLTVTSFEESMSRPVPVVVRLTSSSVSEPVSSSTLIPSFAEEVTVVLSITPDVAVPLRFKPRPAAAVTEMVPAPVKLTVPALAARIASPPLVLTVRSERFQVPLVVFSSRPPELPDRVP